MTGRRNVGAHMYLVCYFKHKVNDTIKSFLTILEF